MAAAIAMLGLLMACLTPAATLVPTATNAPVLVTAATDTATPVAKNGKNSTLQTPKERAATKMANATQVAQSAQPTTSGLATAGQDPQGQYGLVKDKINHIVIIMQENRSFDEYFGTYPGADGIPMQNGVPTVCAPDPQTNTCVKPYANDVNAGGPHAAASAKTDIAGGKMNGFITMFRNPVKACKNPSTPGCAAGQMPDVMG